VQILRKFHGIMLERYTPRSVEGDGNSFYRAISLTLYGMEDRLGHIQLLTAIEHIIIVISFL